MELRKFSRMPVEWAAVFPGREGARDGTVTDISVAGCSMVTVDGLSVGLCLAVEITMPNADRLIAVEQAEVRWAVGPRCGLQFRILTADSQWRIRHLIVGWQSGWGG